MLAAVVGLASAMLAVGMAKACNDDDDFGD
jgi:hypothetical protein